LHLTTFITLQKYIAATYQEHCDADLQEDPHDDDNVAVDEERDDYVERAVLGAHSDEAIQLEAAHRP
jgi:hypothetical protein